MKWGLFISVGLIFIAFFLVSTDFTYYAGENYWNTDKAGIIPGLVHGILAPIMLVVSIFTDYSMYELNNGGWFYNFGFLIGLLFVWGGGTKSTNHIVKNYYTMPKGTKGKSVSMKLSDEDHKRIEKTVEKKVNQKVGEHEKLEKERHEDVKKPRESILANLLVSKKKADKKTRKKK